MKKKIFCIVICTLLIAATIVSVAGSVRNFDEKIFKDNQKDESTNSLLTLPSVYHCVFECSDGYMIAGYGEGPVTKDFDGWIAHLNTDLSRKYQTFTDFNGHDYYYALTQIEQNVYACAGQENQDGATVSQTNALITKYSDTGFAINKDYDIIGNYDQFDSAQGIVYAGYTPFPLPSHHDFVIAGSQINNLALIPGEYACASLWPYSTGIFPTGWEHRYTTPDSLYLGISKATNNVEPGKPAYIYVGGITPPGVSKSSILIVKDYYTTASGWTQDVKIIEDSTKSQIATSVQETDDGGFIITAIRFEEQGVDSEGLLIKLNKNFGHEWNKVHTEFNNMDNAEFYDVKQTRDGGFIIAGCGIGPNSGNQDMWIIKTNSNGVMEWPNYIDVAGINYECGYSVIETSKIPPTYVVAGYTNIYEINPTTVNYDNTGAAIIASLDENGNVEKLGIQNPDENIILSIKSISLGFGVSFTIENSGTTDASDILSEIIIDAPFMFLGGTIQDTISIQAGNQKTISSGFIFGIGQATITVIAGGVTKTVEAFVLGPFIF